MGYETASSPSRRISVRLAVLWALFGAVTAGVTCGPVVIPALRQASPQAAMAGLSAILSGAMVGAVLAVLFQAAGRLRFWVLVLALSAAALVYVATTMEITRSGVLLLWAGLTIAILLSLWHISAYGLHVLRTRRRTGSQSVADNHIH
jgi:hypothetical protein